MYGVNYKFKGNLGSVKNKCIWLNRNLLLKFGMSWKQKYTVLQLEKTLQSLSFTLNRNIFPVVSGRNIDRNMFILYGKVVIPFNKGYFMCNELAALSLYNACLYRNG